MELPGDFISTGFGTMVLWYGVYMSNCVSWRNKFLVAGDWIKKSVWGRDSSRMGDASGRWRMYRRCMRSYRTCRQSSHGFAFERAYNGPRSSGRRTPLLLSAARLGSRARRDG